MWYFCSTVYCILGILIYYAWLEVAQPEANMNNHLSICSLKMVHIILNDLEVLGHSNDSFHMLSFRSYSSISDHLFWSKLTFPLQHGRGVHHDILGRKEILDPDPSVCHDLVLVFKHVFIEKLRSFQDLPIWGSPSIDIWEMGDNCSGTDTNHKLQSVIILVWWPGCSLILDISWLVNSNLGSIQDHFRSGIMSTKPRWHVLWKESWFENTFLGHGFYTRSLKKIKQWCVDQI